MVLESLSNQTFIVNVCVYKDVHPIKRLFWTLSDVFPETVSVIHKMFDLFSYKSKHSAGCVPQWVNLACVIWSIRSAGRNQTDHLMSVKLQPSQILISGGQADMLLSAAGEEGKALITAGTERRVCSSLFILLS